MSKEKETVIKGKLMAARIGPSTFDKSKIEVELGLTTYYSDFIKSSGSFNAYWLNDMLCVLNRARQELDNEDKYEKIVTHTSSGDIITEYKFKEQ